MPQVQRADPRLPITQGLLHEPDRGRASVRVPSLGPIRCSVLPIAVAPRGMRANGLRC